LLITGRSNPEVKTHGLKLPEDSSLLLEELAVKVDPKSVE